MSPEDVPDLIIFSDMQFDSADKSGSLTQFERIEKKFHDLGMGLGGTPYPTPRVIFWNLRSNTKGFPTEDTTPNVQLLAGFSPSLLKAVLIDGVEEEEGEMEMEEEKEGDEEVVVVTKKARKAITPYDTLRRVLDDKRYDDVRESLRESSQELAGLTAPLPSPA